MTYVLFSKIDHLCYKLSPKGINLRIFVAILSKQTTRHHGKERNSKDIGYQYSIIF